MGGLFLIERPEGLLNEVAGVFATDPPGLHLTFVEGDEQRCHRREQLLRLTPAMPDGARDQGIQFVVAEPV